MMQAVDIQQELANIPSEYQAVFIQAIESEMRQVGITTEPEKLAFLRQRREEIENGTFIRPDGRVGVVTLSPDQKYDARTLEQLTKGFGDDDSTDAKEKRVTRLKVGGLLLLVVLFLGFALSGNKSGEEEAMTTQGAVGTISQQEDLTVVPTPTLEPLPETLGNAETLELVGRSGGSLTIGRPGSIELHYQATEETIALAIDPSQTSNRGELTYQESVMLSENPLAVWLFGTVLNYAIGIPDNMVRQLQVGDLIVLNSDTGTSLRFVVVETGSRPNFATTDLLAQNRIGMTLFALPATSEDKVSVAIANYDVSQESIDLESSWGMSDTVPVDGIEFGITGVTYDQTLAGSLNVSLSGFFRKNVSGTTILLGLSSSLDQTETKELSLTDDGWQERFTISSDVQGQRLFAEIRLFPSGVIETVYLGEVPRLSNGLEAIISDTIWHLDRGVVSFQLAISNSGEGDARLSPEYIEITDQGGIVHPIVIPLLPTVIPVKGTIVLDITFVPNVLENVRLRVGRDLWELSGFTSVP